MSRKEDHSFDISFYESILRRNPSYAEVVEILGGLYTKVGRVADGLKMDRKLVRLQPDNATAHYNLACSLALMKRPGDALATLAQAIALGYDDADWMSDDPDLATLRKRPEFHALLQLVRQTASNPKN
jgi:Putative Zn-dependent protease, contains TPR repeats